MSELSNIDISLLTYYKDEINDILNTMNTDLLTRIDAKIDINDEGSPGGIATLSSDGKHTRIEIPWSSAIDIVDETNSDTVVSPMRANALIGYKAIPKTEKGVANGVANIDGNGKIPISLIPDTGSVSSYYTETIVDMYALYGVLQGDRCIVYDDPTPENNKEYIAIVSAPSDASGWKEVPVHSAVMSVNGDVGAVIISAVNTPDIQANKDDIVLLDNKISVNESDISTNKNDISNLDTRVTANTSDIGTNASDIFALDTRITNIEPRVAEIGDTLNRPISPFVGQQYYDTDILQPIWYNGTEWTDALGNKLETTYVEWS